MREFRSVSLADQVFEKLENDIILGVYHRGEILTEMKLVEQLGVSRTPIREALRRLEQERLIAESGRGSMVLGITQDDLMDIMDIRRGIEALAVRHATNNATAEDLAELKHLLELQDFYSARRDIDHLQQIDDEFHSIIGKMSHRTVIRDSLAPLHRKTHRFRKVAIEKESRLLRSVAEHWEIYNAMASGNADAAAECISRHIENAKKSMMKGLTINE